jgi:hypothetical protein
MYPFEEDVDEDLPNEIVAELDARARIQSRVNDDESVFSDVVQDAFRKYQNEVYKEKKTLIIYVYPCHISSVFKILDV